MDTKKTHRFNTRIFEYQHDFIKNEVKNSRVKISEGEILRAALDEYINKKTKNKKNG